MSSSLYEMEPVDISGQTPHEDYHCDSESVHTTGILPSTTTHIPSHLSHTHDAPPPIQPYTSFVEIPDEVYDRISPSRKLIIVALLSYCGFLAPVSSTTILSAIPEVAATYHSTGTIINLSNALYLVFMGVSRKEPRGAKSFLF